MEGFSHQIPRQHVEISQGTSFESIQLDCDGFIRGRFFKKCFLLIRSWGYYTPSPPSSLHINIHPCAPLSARGPAATTSTGGPLLPWSPKTTTQKNKITKDTHTHTHAQQKTQQENRTNTNKKYKNNKKYNKDKTDPGSWTHDLCKQDLETAGNMKFDMQCCYVLLCRMSNVQHATRAITIILLMLWEGGWE